MTPQDRKLFDGVARMLKLHAEQRATIDKMLLAIMERETTLRNIRASLLRGVDVEYSKQRLKALIKHGQVRPEDQ